MHSLSFLSPVFRDPHFPFTRILRYRVKIARLIMNQVSKMSVSVILQVIYINFFCSVYKSSENGGELERFKRLVYTLHPKATSLRMHSMRKNKVTIMFTMAKVSNKSSGASWYYKIHPTHRRNTIQSLLYSVVRVLHINIYVHTSPSPFQLVSLRTLFSLRRFFPLRERLTFTYLYLFE